MSSQPATQLYTHGRYEVSGGIIPNATTAFRTYGDSKDPCIVFPTCYGGKLDDQLYMVGEGKALDTSRYFVVTFALFSNGESSSPSNTPAPFNGPYFPAVSYEDNIRAQYAVLTKHLGIRHVFCAIGFSMGGQQAYHWATLYPSFVSNFVVICGSARTSPHNYTFLDGLKATLTASKDFDNGHYLSPPQHGIRAFGRVYCAWAYGQTWFREHKYISETSSRDLPSFIREHWETSFLGSWDANDLLTLLQTWQTGDISNGGDLGASLRGIQAAGLIMPCKTDLYFPPEDNEKEMQYLNNKSKHVVIPSIWGHMAGGGANAADDAFIHAQVESFFNTQMTKAQL